MSVILMVIWVLFYTLKSNKQSTGEATNGLSTINGDIMSNKIINHIAGTLMVGAVLMAGPILMALICHICGV